MILSIPEDPDDLEMVLSYFTTLTPGFVKLLSLLKNERESATSTQT